MIKIWWHNFFDFWIAKQFEKVPSQLQYKFVSQYLKRKSEGELNYFIALCENYKKIGVNENDN